MKTWKILVPAVAALLTQAAAQSNEELRREAEARRTELAPSRRKHVSG